MWRVDYFIPELGLVIDIMKPTHMYPYTKVYTQICTQKAHMIKNNHMIQRPDCEMAKYHYSGLV